MNTNSAVVRDMAYFSLRAYSSCFRSYKEPRVFVNSVPKAGTHLLRTLLEKSPQFRFYGLHIETTKFIHDLDAVQNPDRQLDYDFHKLRKKLTRVPNGQFVTGHLQFNEELYKLFKELNYKIIFMVRDPRDIVVSHANYVNKLKRHKLYRYYNDILTTDKERLLASINGFSRSQAHMGLIDVGERLRRFKGWVEKPDVLVCKFEELIGGKGGGDDLIQRKAVEGVLDFISRYVSSEAEMNELTSQIWAPKSATFRKGIIGDWVNHFDQDVTAAFSAKAGDMLSVYGYSE